MFLSGYEHDLSPSIVNVDNLQERETLEQDSCDYNYDRLRNLDPVAANRIHPNDHRKVSLL